MTKAIWPREGECYSVPLSGGDGWVVVARVGRAGQFLGYFFGSDAVGNLENEALASQPAEALVIMVTGHLGIKKGTWTMLGRLTGWDRDQWPMPLFHRPDPLRPGRAAIVEYDPDDPTTEIGVRGVPVDQAGGLPEDGLAGHGFAEKRLARLFDASRQS